MVDSDSICDDVKTINYTLTSVANTAASTTSWVCLPLRLALDGLADRDSVLDGTDTVSYTLCSIADTPATTWLCLPFRLVLDGLADGDSISGSADTICYTLNSVADTVAAAWVPLRNRRGSLRGLVFDEGGPDVISMLSYITFCGRLTACYQLCLDHCQGLYEAQLGGYWGEERRGRGQVLHWQSCQQ